MACELDDSCGGRERARSQSGHQGRALVPNKKPVRTVVSVPIATSKLWDIVVVDNAATLC